MKKRVLALLLAAAVAASLVACGGTTGNTEGGSQNTENNTENEKQDLSNITDTFGINDAGSYVQDGNKITATTEKGEWSFFSYLIKEDAKAMNAVKLELEDATAGAVILLKLEGGDGVAVEKQFTLTGGAQTIEFNVSGTHFASDGNGRLLVFMAPGQYVNAGQEPFMTVKNVGLINNAANITNNYGMTEEGAYVKEGAAVKATAAGKGEWSHFFYEIPGDATGYNTVVFDVENAVAGLEIMLKLEGEGVTAVEQRFTLEGGRQTIEWTVAAENFSAEGKGKLVVFVAPGQYVAEDSHVTITSVTLATK